MQAELRKYVFMLSNDGESLACKQWLHSLGESVYNPDLPGGGDCVVFSGRWGKWLGSTSAGYTTRIAVPFSELQNKLKEGGVPCVG